MIESHRTCTDPKAQMIVEVYRHGASAFLIVRPSQKVAYPATEHEEQSILVGYLRARGTLVFAVPNEGQRSKVVAQRHKREGLLSGASDLVWVLPGQTVYCEMKKAAGTLSDIDVEQRRFLADVASRGHLAVACFGFAAGRYVHERLEIFTRFCAEVQHADLG